MAKSNFEIDESDIDEYEEVQNALAKFEDSSAELLKAIAGRDEMVGLLKIASPSKIAGVRQCIAEWDSLIEYIEEIIKHNLELVEKSRNLVRSCKRLEAFNDAVEPALLKYAEENPEKRELIEAILSDEGKSH